MMIIVCVLSPSIYLGGLYFSKVGQEHGLRRSGGVSGLLLLDVSLVATGARRRELSARCGCRCAVGS